MALKRAETEEEKDPYLKEAEANYKKGLRDLKYARNPKTIPKFRGNAKSCYADASVEFERAAQEFEGRRDYSRAISAYEKALTAATAIQSTGLANILQAKIDELQNAQKGKLENSVASSLAIAGILGGIFFLSSNITGNAIADLTTKTTSFLGAGLLIVGLVAGFFWVKSRKK